MSEDIGATLKGQALPASPPEPLRVSSLSGNDPSRWSGPRYSPNLSKWIRKQGRRHAVFGMPKIFLAEDGLRWIGWIDDDRWFYGTRLNRVLVAGSKAEVFAHPTVPGVEDRNFWGQYEALGRCAIDKSHTTDFVGSETRWRTKGDVRECLWCGEYRQQRERYTFSEDRERWIPCDDMETSA